MGLEKVLTLSEKKKLTIAVRLKTIDEVRKHMAGLENLKEISHLLVTNTPIQEKTGSCMEARPKGPHT